MTELNSTHVVRIRWEESQPDKTYHYFIKSRHPAIRQHVGWQSVRWQGKRYQLHGLIRGPAFINLARPL